MFTEKHSQEKLEKKGYTLAYTLGTHTEVWKKDNKKVYVHAENRIVVGFVEVRK